MTQNNLIDNLTVIIASLNDYTAFDDCLDNLRNWPVRVIFVSKPSPYTEKKIIDEGYKWIKSDASCSLSLWNKGLENSTTSWNLLIRSNEVVSGRLKKSIEKKILRNPAASKFYLPLSKGVFLKKVLKYQFNWSEELPSGLFYKAEDVSLNLISIKNEPLEGELIRLGETTVSLACSRALEIAESRYIRLRSKNSSLGKTELIVITLKNALFALFGNLFLRQVFRERFEGLIFCILDVYSHFMGGIFYYEKQIRGGGQISNQIQGVKKILIIKIMGIGDVVMATPVFRNIKVLLPHTSLSVLVASPVDSILEGNPYIDKLHSLPKNITIKNILATISPLINDLNNEKFDLIINLQSKNLSSAILKKVHAKWKIDRSYYYRDKNTDVLIGCETLNRSGIERDLDCLRQIGLEPRDKDLEIVLKSSDMKNAEEFFVNNDLDPNRKTVFIHPVASVGIREWGIEKFSKLCRILNVEHKFQIIINVSKQEKQNIKPILDAFPEVIIFSGTVREMLGIIKKCNLLIGNDSGPSHLSVALDVPTIVFNGPSSVSLYRDPDIYTERHFVFNKEVPCRDLFQTQCYSYIDPQKNIPICQDQICLDFSVDEVVAKAIELI